MEMDLDPDIIKATQVSLGKYVKRPPLSEKLLKKPPFRFLHDIITTVLKTTGFFENLFDEEELISENVKDRESKISFLNKVIFVLSSTTGKAVSIKPSKIVAGQEPAKTNELLQCLAQALDKKLSSHEAVKKYKESIKTTQTVEVAKKETTKIVKKGNEPKKLTSKSNEKLTSQKSDVSARITSKADKVNDTKSKKKEIGSTKTELQQKKLQQSKLTSKKKSENKGQNNDDREQKCDTNSKRITEKQKLQVEQIESAPINLESHDTTANEEKDKPSDNLLKAQHTSTHKEEPNEKVNLNDSYTIGENDLNSSSSSRDLLEAVNVIEENQSLEVIMNSVISDNDNNRKDNRVEYLERSGFSHETNEPEPSVKDDIQNDEPENRKDMQNIEPNNKVKSASSQPTYDSTNQIVRPQSVRPSSSRPGAPRMREKLDTNMKDTDNLLLGKVNIIIENPQNEEEEDTSLVIINPQFDATSSSKDQEELHTSSNEHGHLVQQILESQKELSQISGRTEIEWQFGAQKAREVMNQEIEQLRFNIQALSRVANPLGKLLDHMQEDVEVMRQELQQWTTIYDDVMKEMLKQKTINEDSLLPLHTKLKHLEGDIEEKHIKMNDLKILIHKNASRIEKLLASGNVQ